MQIEYIFMNPWPEGAHVEHAPARILTGLHVRELRRVNLLERDFAGVKAPVLFHLFYDNFAQFSVQDRETYLP